jgi:hypothetical protein
MINTNKTFEDLVQAVQTIAYGEGQYMNEDSRTTLQNIAISTFQVQEQTQRVADQMERIANVLETLVELYEWNLPKKNPKPTMPATSSIYQKHPGIDMTNKVQAVLEKIRARQ